MEAIRERLPSVTKRNSTTCPVSRSACRLHVWRPPRLRWASRQQARCRRSPRKTETRPLPCRGTLRPRAEGWRRRDRRPQRRRERPLPRRAFGSARRRRRILRARCLQLRWRYFGEISLVAEFCCSTDAGWLPLPLKSNPARRDYDWRCLRLPWRFAPQAFDLRDNNRETFPASPARSASIVDIVNFCFPFALAKTANFADPPRRTGSVSRYGRSRRPRINAFARLIGP